MTHPSSRHARRHLRFTAAVTAVVTVLTFGVTQTAHAVSTWNPTMLVNTESFQEIDAGDGTTAVELRFGASTKTLKFLTTNRFQFSHSISVNGTMSGAALRVDGNADVWGSVSATGAIKTKSDLTINSDADTNDATFTFGNNTANQTFKFLNGSQKFELSKGLNVRGNLSGSSLRIDGNAAVWGNLSATGTIKTSGTVKAGTLSGTSLTVDDGTTINNVSYTWPGAQGAANTFLKNDGVGGLSWATTSVGPSSGNILSLHPEYQNAVYVQSGSTAVGTLKYSASGALDNYYRWSTTKGTLQDYWINVRVQVPKNFSHFETASGIQLRLRTATTNSADNQITVRVVDTAGASIAVGNNANLVSTIANEWRTNTITGVTGGTFTPLGYITLLIKVAATSTGFTDLGFINLNWSNITP